jgi:endonuclease/exonuclease/phosphatase family metal-dependent hydrolase
MNIVAYNLRFGGRINNRVHWQHVFDVASPDIFLAQETCSPDKYLSSAQLTRFGRQLVWAKVANVSWGSAVFVRSGRIRPIVLPRYEGYVTGAEVTRFDWAHVGTKRLRIFSVHVPAPYKRPMNEILDQIAALPNAAACDHIIGGDFNLTTGVRHPTEKRQQHDLWLLERLRKEFNLMNCWQIANPNRNLPQTLRWGWDKAEPYHCDAIFVPASWYRHLDGCEVLSSPEWNELSDHNPVLVRLSN